MNKLYIRRRIKYRLGLYNRHNTALNRFTFRLLLCLALITAVFFGSTSKIGTLAVDLGASRLENDIVYECSQITSRLMSENNFTYEDIILQTVNSSGKITALSTDFEKVNFLKKSVSQELSKYMNSLKRIKIGVPAGALLSNDIFTGLGFDIPAHIAISGNATVKFGDDFVSAGINQTKHRLMLSINVNVSIYGAFCKQNRTLNFDIPLAETIIVGDTSGILIEKSIDN